MNLSSRNLRASEIRLSSERRAPRQPGNSPQDDEAAARQKLRVMIVEDELFVAMHLEAVLEEIGYDVTGIAPNGESALEEFRSHRPDIVLMDINLGSGIDGVTAAQQLVARDDVQIIFVSAYSDGPTRARVEAALPGSRVLSKPVTPDSLKRAIDAQTQRPH
jgi:CheY-like chemotaxis protein